MFIDNFDKISKFIDFLPGTFYKFEAIVRNTDGLNPLYREGLSKNKRNLPIKAWFIDSVQKFEDKKHEMKTLCDLTGARLYMTLDRKSTKKFCTYLSDYTYEVMRECSYTNQVPSLKRLKKAVSSVSSVKETSEKTGRTVLFDIDSKDEDVKNRIIKWLKQYTDKWLILETKKGWHIVTSRIAKDKWAEYLETYETEIDVSLIDNGLGLVYMNLAETTSGLGEGEENE